MYNIQGIRMIATSTQLHIVTVKCVYVCVCILNVSIRSKMAHTTWFGWYGFNYNEYFYGK